MDNTKIVQKPQTQFESKLAQEDYNINVAFYVHLKEYNNTVRDELEKRLGEVFLFSKGVEWKFDSFGIEKTGSRGKQILGYFIFRTANITDLQKLFIKEFGDYKNALKITCSVAEYKKIDEKFFEVKL
ncbi:conserved hypothetical protein [Arcobacter nitrofigilis DSM 7299]|uniref:Uncharacterized protein n=1 Tax=Arcobacter nitrofigilis (strain ATCC 33309 / DSM 7299 / CCUG 15893 / LMG 7604 / NCTC 12251 / CI) TaxID=572480 RepID=D5V7U5_ARCNC|nr:hypothetical protein [Arcobacter nitrofigilis]ADG94715.1 conserved hypothetical protein [Arcobacter nitrofigilis DSM 7299]